MWSHLQCSVLYMILVQCSLPCLLMAIRATSRWTSKRMKMDMWMGASHLMSASVQKRMDYLTNGLQHFEECWSFWLQLLDWTISKKCMRLLVWYAFKTFQWKKYISSWQSVYQGDAWLLQDTENMMITQQELICRTQNSRPQTEPFTAKHTAVIFLLCLSDIRSRDEHL